MTQPSDEHISPKLIESVRAELDRGAYVRHKLPGWGRLHIDRQLPFLSVYRRPADRADAGTSRLLLGEAAYLLASGEAEDQAGLSRLVSEILGIQLDAFGACLLLELWSGADSSTQQPAFRLMTPAQQAPTLLLERLESALLGIEIAGEAAQVSLEYPELIAPPGLPPLLDVDVAPRGIWQIGLEVKPIYRDTKTGELFPFELRELHHRLTHALKQGFYSFAHRYTRQRPAHYHQLGRRAMTSAVWETDRQLAGISDRFDMLLHVTPVNAAQAWQVFKRQGFEQAPSFNYRPRPVDPDLMKRQLYQIAIERIEDPTLAYLFASKRDELDRQVTMIADRNTERFLPGSLQVYGGVEPWLLELARQLVGEIDPVETRNIEEGYLDVEALADRAREEIAWYRRAMPELSARVEVRDDVTGIMVSRGHFLIGTDARVSLDRVEASLAHEIGTHILTYYNGQHQPFHQLQAGMAGYEPLQEGLAVLAEYMVGQLGRSRLRMLAGRVLAVHSLIQGAAFSETFETLTADHDFGELAAFNITLRVYRGGGFSKDAVYLRGLATLLEYLGSGGDLEILYLGKLSLEALPLIEELKWRKVLKPSPLRPRYFEGPGAEERLRRLRQGMSLPQLLEECGH